MEDASARQFLSFSSAKLRELAGRIDHCLEQLSDQQVWARGGENENSAGNLVLHLCGNVRQWIVAGVGGEPDIRRRDDELAARGGLAGGDLRERLRDTVAQAAAVIDGVSAGRFAERLAIQGYDVSVMEAIYHVVEHFSMHAGQIMLIAKMQTGADLNFYPELRSAARTTRSALK